MDNMLTRLLLVIVSVLVSFGINASTVQFQKDKWQLVSFTQLPQDATISSIFGELGTNGGLIAVWGFDNASKQWTSWPQKLGIPTSNLSVLETGKGYWVKTSQDLELVIDAAVSNTGEQILYPGWNLIGMASETELSHEQAFAGVPYLELWSYDQTQNAFLSVRKSGGSQIILQEEFTQIKPGQGYWLYVTEQTSLIPNMGTLLPPDVDLEPLLNLTQYGVETPWDTISPGDVDWDGDGYFDFPNTQSTVAFGDFLNRQRLAITNKGNGVLSWQAKLDPPVKWLMFEAFDEEGQPVLTNHAIGNVSDTNGELVLVTNRVGLAPSDNYTTELVLTANGSTAEKRIAVNMAVADVVGDYEVTVRLDEVDGKKADLHNPKYFLSFARDGNGVKAFLDEERSLLIPETTYLSGSYINDPQSHFQVLGQLFLPMGHEHNPYQNDIRREFTIIGQRSDGRDGLSPLDLKGTYAENIYGIFDDPIQLTGEFVADRLSPIPKKKDLTITLPVTGEIVSSAENDGISLFEFDVTDRYSITDIKTNISIEHSLPQMLDVALISPKNTKISLHSQQHRAIGDLRFDEHDTSIESLDLLDGQLSLGKWKLEIKNHSTTVGQLNAWTMDISGAKVYNITGQTTPGIRLQLSGCGIVQTTISDGSTGEFNFDHLVPCDYDISVSQLGYASTLTSVRIQGCFKTLSQPCNTEQDYQVNLSSAQLQELQPQLVATSGVMKVIVSPTQTYISNDSSLNTEVQAVDVTDYSQLNQTLLARTWSFYKKNASAADSLISSIGSNSGSWGHSVQHLEENAGLYYVRLTSRVRLTNGTEVNKEFTTADIAISYNNLSGIHMGSQSYYGAAGSAGMKAMDMATFDIDRPPYMVDSEGTSIGNQGPEDSDSFKAIVDDATETNQANDLFQNPQDPSQFSFVPTGLDDQAGNLKKHYRMHISTGQLIHSPPVYGGNFKLDIGIQTSEGAEE